MVDLNNLSPSALSAAIRGGTDNWGEWGSAEEHVRYAEPIKSRRKCYCGCEGLITHNGMANGVSLIQGCELSINRWARATLDRIGK